MADWITEHIAIGDCQETPPEGALVMDIRWMPDHCAIRERDLDYCCELLEDYVRSGRKVFVHCIGGISRSPSVVAAFLATRGDISVAQAYENIRAKRPQIQPHALQVKSVEEYVRLFY